MQLIVLSAGRGSRLPRKFRNKPKCLVEINKIPLLLYNKPFFKKFKNKTIVTGYKNKYLKEVTEKIGFKNIINKKYLSTNMVYSLFLANKIIKEDVIVMYGDIIFHEKIYNKLQYNHDVLPVNINWLRNWKNRMSFKNILNDAENLVINKKYLSEIGSKIEKNKLPKYQFMGIIKFKKKTYQDCHRYFKKLNNKKIDMTSFLNLCVLNKIISLKIQKYDGYWYEIDSSSDHKFAEKDIKKLKLNFKQITKKT